MTTGEAPQSLKSGEAEELLLTQSHVEIHTETSLTHTTELPSLLSTHARK